MKFRILFTSMLVAALMASLPAEAAFQDLRTALRALMAADTSSPYPADVKSRLLDCGARSFVNGIPAADQAQMLSVFNGGALTPQADAAFVRWFGYSPSSPKRTTNATVLNRIQQSARQFCPDLIQQYPEFFNP